MNKLIMAVDDDLSVLKLLEVLLKRHHFVVGTARDAYTALSVLETLTPDLFILDVMMPGMDGIELCRHIRAHPHTAPVPVIFLSARSDSESVERGLAAGANAYLAKSELVEGLLPKIRGLLQPQPAAVDPNLLACVGA